MVSGGRVSFGICRLIWGIALITTSSIAQEAPSVPLDSPASRANKPPPSRYGLAPIRWGGLISDDVRWSSSEGASSDRVSNVLGIQVRAATYLIQPYIAQLNGNIGLTTSQENSEQSSGGGFLGITGGMELSLFPASRFPFRASFDRSDSRASDSFANSDYINTRISMSQNYRPLNSSASYAFGWDRSVLESATFGEDKVDSVNGNFTRRVGAHDWDVSGNFATSERSNAESNQLVRTSVRHNWQQEDGLWTVNNLFSLNDSQLHTSSQADNQSRFLQLNSFGTWRPDLESHLLVSGGVRVFRTDSDQSGNQTNSQVISANVGASYPLNRHTSVSGGASMSQVQANETNSLQGAVNGNLNYTPDALTFGNYSYRWNASSNLSQTFSSQGDSQSGIGVGAGHSLSRDWMLSPTSAINLSLNQDFGTSLTNSNGDGDRNGNASSLSHGAGLSWRFNPREDSTANLSLSVADSRSIGSEGANFQMATLQANGLMNMSKYSTGNANLTFQWSQSSNSTSTENSIAQTSAYGSLSYSHSRFFNVNRLYYTALLHLDTIGVDSRQQGNASAPRDPVSKSFEQRLDYRIGRLDIRLAAMLSDAGGKKNANVFLRVSRDFGGR